MPRRPRRGHIADGTFAAVIRAYQASPDYGRLAPGTREVYNRVLRVAEQPETLGALSVYELRPALVQAFLDGLSDIPSLPVRARTALAAVERWAIVRDLLPGPITLGTYVAVSRGGHEPWPDALVALAEAHAKPCLSRAINLMVHTGQRGSDVVRMRWSDVEERFDHLSGRDVLGINVRQQKTGRRLWVPFSDEMVAIYAGWAKTMPPFFVLDSRGGPFTRPRLSVAWDRELKANKALAPIREAGLVLHGLRATCVVRLRKRGATDLQISNMVGMSESMVARYSRLADQSEMAMAALHYLNAGAPKAPFAKPRQMQTIDKS
jgi:integrase